MSIVDWLLRVPESKSKIGPLRPLVKIDRGIDGALRWLTCGDIDSPYSGDEESARRQTASRRKDALVQLGHVSDGFTALTSQLDSWSVQRDSSRTRIREALSQREEPFQRMQLACADLSECLPTAKPINRDHVSTLKEVLRDIEDFYQDQGEAVVEVLVDAYQDEAVRIWKRKLRGQEAHAYHGTSALFIESIQELGLCIEVVPEELRNAADVVVRYLPELCKTPWDVKQEFSQRRLALSWTPNVLRAAVTPGFPAFAYELLSEEHARAHHSRLSAAPSAEAIREVRMAWAVGKQFRDRSRPITLRIRIDDSLFAALGAPGVLSQSEAFVSFVLNPHFRKEIRSAAIYPSLPDSIMTCMFIFGSEKRDTEIETQIHGTIPPEFIDVPVAVSDSSVRWLSIREWQPSQPLVDVE